MRKKHKLALFALFIISILVGSALQLYFVYGAEAINMGVSGTHSSPSFYSDLSGQSFLGKNITIGHFTYDWTVGVNKGEIKIHTIEHGMLTIEIKDGTYNDITRTFQIKKFTVSYPVGYPYTLTFDEVYGSYTSTEFTCVIVGRYTEGGSSSGGSSSCTDCCTVTYTNDSAGQVIHVEARGDKDITNVGVLFYATGGGSQSVNMNKVSDRLYFVDFSYGSTPVRSFTVSVTFKDGTSSTDYYTVSTSSSSSWGTWTGGSTSSSSDYTTALNLAKAKNFTTVMELINDMNSSIKNKNASITTMQDQLRVKATEYESLKATSDQYQRDSANWKSQYEQKNSAYNTLDTKYTELLKNQTPSNTNNGAQLPTDIKLPKELLGLGAIAVILLILWKKGKLPSIRNRKKKFDPTEYREEVKRNGNGHGIPQNGNQRHEQSEYIIRDDMQADDNGRKTMSKEAFWEKLRKAEQEQQELIEEAKTLGIKVE